MVVLDKKLDMKSTQTITKEDSRQSSKSRLRTGYEMTLEDLLYAALMQSDNRAARALARAVSGTYEEFASEMNAKVKSLGLQNTVFYEPTGLDERNVSTAHEVAKMVQYAYEYPMICKITTTRRYQVRVMNKKNFRRQLGNTNRFLVSPYKVLAGKTGYIIEADYCLTTMLQNKEGERMTLVVLGTPGDRLRFREARKLADWGFRKI
jgi:D-alanyl-D-alanine endopeptidase (penicillin-binding protein 7)